MRHWSDLSRWGELVEKNRQAIRAEALEEAARAVDARALRAEVEDGYVAEHLCDAAEDIRALKNTSPEAKP